MLLGGGSNCQGCGCVSRTPIRYVVAMRDWYIDPVFYQFGWMSDSFATGSFLYACVLPSNSVAASDFLILDDTAWNSIMSCASANSRGGIPGLSFVPGSTVPGYECVTSVKWDAGYMWMSVATSDGSTFALVYRKPMSGSLSSSRDVGKVVFTSSDVYSLVRNGSASTDYTGIGEVAYCAFPDSGIGTFKSKTVDASFGTPSIQSFQVLPNASCPSKPGYRSVENILAGTISVSLSGSGSPSADGDTNWGCYSNSSTVGNGRGCAVWMAASKCEYATYAGGSYGSFSLVESLRIAAQGSRTAWLTPSSGDTSCSSLVESVTVPSCSGATYGNASDFSIGLKADWFDAFTPDGVIADTKRLARWGAPLAYRAGWFSAFGNATVMISVY